MLLQKHAQATQASKQSHGLPTTWIDLCEHNFVFTLILSISSILTLRSATFIVDRSPRASSVCRIGLDPYDPKVDSY